jgi:hypothetical protein
MVARSEHHRAVCTGAVVIPEDWLGVTSQPTWATSLAATGLD